ncbi:hypothetical protein D7030_00695 [Flavobacteriaceae bacterium AU392]|nr:hypothetical protein D1817_03230 [Flavobacteriaceae bacterium]RKM86579.1 hypothetical protein D7030_00695 [Flavobacteriaceae bacterium AU392]
MIKGFKQLLNILIMKNLKNLGKALNKIEQKAINGGSNPDACRNDRDCEGSVIPLVCDEFTSTCVIACV